MKKFPNHRDGQVLKLMNEKGADFSKEHGIEFFFYFNGKKSAYTAKNLLEQLGLEVEISDGGGDSSWSCIATTRIIPGYFALNRFRSRVERIANELNGKYDGWGTLIK